MKLYVAVLLMMIGVTCAAIVNSNGRPACQTDEEMKTIVYRNTWDPTRYWACEVKGQAASARKCDDGLGWLDSIKTCVDWTVWTWEVPNHPPSRAY